MSEFSISSRFHYETYTTDDAFNPVHTSTIRNNLSKNILSCIPNYTQHTNINLIKNYITDIQQMYRVYAGEDGLEESEKSSVQVEIGPRGALNIITEKKKIAALELRLQVLQHQLEDKMVHKTASLSLNIELRECLRFVSLPPTFL